MTPQETLDPTAWGLVGWAKRLQSGEATSEALVGACLARIEALDQQGPSLRAVLAVNPAALTQACALDAHRARTGEVTGPLHGLPIILKDNIDTEDMPTTGGCEALATLQPARDATVVRRLREAGAIIIAKANLQELALGGLSVSSLGGQVRNPYDLNRTPGGSSGGSAVALVAGYAVAALGTDTVNSIRSPASATGIVGLRPTHGLISRAGIMPVSAAQDVVGPIVRHVEDLRPLLQVLAGFDPLDAATAHGASASLGKPGQGGDRPVRIGVLRSLHGGGTEHVEVNRLMADVRDALAGQGAHFIDVHDFAPDADDLIASLDVQRWEFGAPFNDYLRAHGDRSPVSSLSALLADGRHLPAAGGFLADAASVAAPDEDVAYLRRLEGHRRLRTAVLAAMARHDVDALCYPHQRCLVAPIGHAVQPQRNGILAALTGLPALTIPAGRSAPSPHAPLGIPVGFELLARPFEEAWLLSVGELAERALPVSTLPSLV